MRTIEILALGADLRREAESQCHSVNEAHFAVHEVVSDALACNPILARGASLHDELSSRVRLRLIEGSTSRCDSIPFNWDLVGRLRQ